MIFTKFHDYLNISVSETYYMTGCIKSVLSDSVLDVPFEYHLLLEYDQFIWHIQKKLRILCTMNVKLGEDVNRSLSETEPIFTNFGKGIFKLYVISCTGLGALCIKSY